MAATESTRITKLLKETVSLLCQNSLTFSVELQIQALLAVTVDHSTVIVVQVDEKLGKDGESVSSGTQGPVSSKQRPAAARRLALPAPVSQSSSSDGSGLAWPLHSPQQPRGALRTRGPRFPVGRGRGVSRGGRGRGGAVRGVVPPVRTIRTAVSSVRFPVSRPRMMAPAPQAAVQRLAILPANLDSPRTSPRQVVVRQRAPAPARQVSPAGGQRVASQTMMRKPSPRLAIMPPTQCLSMQSSPSDSLRQRSPAMLPRQAWSVQAGASLQGVGRPRLAIISSPVNSQSAMLRSSQPRAMSRQSSPRLAVMPPSQSPARCASLQSSVVRSPAQPRVMAPQSSPRLALMPPSQSPVRSANSQSAVLRSPQARTMAPQSSPRLALMPPSQSPVRSANSQSTVLRSPQARTMAPQSSQRLALMPPSQSPVRSANSQSTVLRSPQARTMAPQSSPRLALMPPSQSLVRSGNVQPSVVKSPAQPRAMPPQSLPRFALMPPPQSPIRSSQQPLTMSSPAKSATELVARPTQLSAATVRQQSSTSMNAQLARLAGQLSSSSVGTQLHAVVENLSQQHGQPIAVQQNVTTKSVSMLPVSQQPRQSVQSIAVSVTTATALRPMIAVNLSKAGSLKTSAVTVASTQSVSRPVHENVTLSDNLLSFIHSVPQYAASQMPVAVTQKQTVIMTSANRTSAVVSGQPVSPFHTTLHQPYLTTAQYSSIAGIQRFGLPTTQLATPPRETMNALLISAPHVQFSSACLQALPSQQVSAMPLYASPSHTAAPVPLSPTYRMGAGDVHQHPHGILQKDVMVAPASPFGMSHAGGGDGTVTGVHHMAMQPACTTIRHLVLSPQPRLPLSSVGCLQQYDASQFSPQQQQRQASSSIAQMYALSSQPMATLAHSSGQYSSPLKSPMPASMLQQGSQNSAQVSSLGQSQVLPTYVQQMSQNLQQTASQSQPSVPAILQRKQKLDEVMSLQSQMPAVSPQQFVIRPREGLAPAHGQPIPNYMSKFQNPQQVSAPAAAVASPQPKSQNAQQAEHMQKNVMQYRLPVQLSAASVQAGQIVSAQQSQLGMSHVPSSAVMRTEVNQAVSHEPHNAASALVPQALENRSEQQERQAVLEMIKQQACEQLRQVKQSSGAQQRTATAVSSTSQITLASIPQQTASGGRLTAPSVPQQPVPASVYQTSSVSSLAVQQQPTVSEQNIPQRAASSSSSRQLTASSFPWQTVSSPSSPAGAVLSNKLQQALSSQSGQLSSPSVQHQSRRSEPRTPQHTCSSLSATFTPQSYLSVDSVCDNSTSVVTSLLSASQHDAASADAGVKHDATLYKQLLDLKERFQKARSVEHGRQKIIASQLQQLQSDDDAGAELAADDVAPSSSEVSVIIKLSSGSPTGSATEQDEDARCQLQLEASASGTDGKMASSSASAEQINNLQCRAAACMSTFSQACQLAVHYEDTHPACAFGPPRDKHDLALYKRHIVNVHQQQRSAKPSKRKRRIPQHDRPNKRSRTKLSSGRYECDDCGRKFSRATDLNKHIRESHFESTDEEDTEQ